MKEVFKKFREVARNRAVKTAAVCGAVAGALMSVASAEETPIDLTSAVSGVSSGISALATSMLNIVGTIATAALPVIACVLIWKFGMKIFKKLTGQAG